MSTDYLDDGLVWIDAPGPDIIVDPTGRKPSVRIGVNEKHELTPDLTRRLAEKLFEAADVAEGREHSTAGERVPESHRCPYPAAGCTSPDCHITAARRHQIAHEALSRRVGDVAAELAGMAEVTYGSAPGAYADASNRIRATLKDEQRAAIGVDDGEGK